MKNTSMKVTRKFASLGRGAAFYAKVACGLMLTLANVSCGRPAQGGGYLPITEYESKTCTSHNIYVYYTNPLSKFIYPKHEVFKLSDNKYELVLYNPFGIRAITQVINAPKGEEYKIGSKVNESFTCEE